jgi:hypothetical protein
MKGDKMFNLEHSIIEWRTQMLAAGIKTPVPLDELEIHLHEEIERASRSGLNAAEAFTSAVQKIGLARTVQDEFEKVEAAGTERKRKEGRFWAGAIIGLLQLIFIGTVLFNSEMTFGQRMSGLAAMATSFLLAGVARLSHRIFPASRAQGMRTAMIFILGNVPGIVWLWIFARFYLPGHEFPFGQYLATLLWAGYPSLGVAFGLILGIEAADRKKLCKDAREKEDAYV